MCGIAGFIDLDFRFKESGLKRMLANLSHRGPDDEGLWKDESAGIAFGHRRLSILDLSPSGHQPMCSFCQRYVIAFNGEIYNWSELKKALEQSGDAPRWRGSSDTEIFLTAISVWGLSAALRRVRGMFAFALWDRAEKQLVLVRDRIGEKPLYYGTISGQFVFASELKAFSALSDKSLEMEPGALALMLRYGYVPDPYSIYKNIFKLPPGKMICVSNSGRVGKVKTYWSFSDFLAEQQKNNLQLSDDEAVNELDKLMANVVQEQMVADVPLGAFLSGGLDSSTVVAIMQANSPRRVKTFTIGYQESAYDEADHARLIARYLGTEHTELKLTASQSLDIIPYLPDMYDEPFADASQISTAIISKLTRNHVGVCLSGDAGDELFGGYNRYLWADTIWNTLAKIPTPVRQPLGDMLNHMPVGMFNGLFSCISPVLPNKYHINNPGDKLHKIGQIMSARSRDHLYQNLVSQWRGSLPLRNVEEPSTYLSNPEEWPSLKHYSERMMAVDTQSYLPQDILVKVDRAAMAASLETRLPFLDLKLMEFAWRLPLHQKIRHGKGKWIMRQLLSRYLPETLWDRPKQGFALPIEHWLRGPLRDWAEDLLAPDKLAKDDHLDPKAIRHIWDQHLKGHNLQYALWNILSYRAWRDRWL